MPVECVPFVEPPKFPHGWPERIEHRIVKAALKVELPTPLRSVIAEHWRASGLIVASDPVFVACVGWRHSDIMSYARFHGLADYVSQEMQGFVCNMGWFFDRRRAAVIATGARQCRADSLRANTLLSEDLWDTDGKPRDPAKPFDPRAG